jgi:hypothetical protein
MRPTSSTQTVMQIVLPDGTSWPLELATISGWLSVEHVMLPVPFEGGGLLLGGGAGPVPPPTLPPGGDAMLDGMQVCDGATSGCPGWSGTNLVRKSLVRLTATTPRSV